MNDNASNSDHSGVSYRVYYSYALSSQVFYFSSECLRLRMAVTGLFTPVFQTLFSRDWRLPQLNLNFTRFSAS